MYFLINQVLCFLLLTNQISWLSYLSHLTPLLQETYFYIPTPTFHWLPPLSPPQGSILLTTCLVSSLFLALGICPRLASVLTCLSSFYLSTQDQSSHDSRGLSVLLQLAFVNCSLSLGRCAEGLLCNVTFYDCSLKEAMVCCVSSGL